MLLFSLLAFLKPTIPFALVVLFAILLDCWSAYDLNRRLRKQYPANVAGKFQSHYALKMFKTFFQVYTVIVLIYAVDTVLLKEFHGLNMANIAAAIFCALQLWSILENLSSANGAKWAKQAQRILVDKSKRHFDIDIEKNE
jgi:L-lactate permease